MSKLQTVKQYKSHIASSYKLITPEQASELPKGKLFASKKYDGLFCCLTLDSKEKKLLLPNGSTVPKDAAIGKELQKIQCDEEIIIAGELYALSKDAKRERYSDVHAALSKTNDDKMHFAAFDIVQGATENLDSYPKKIDHIAKILQGLTYFHSVEVKETDASKVLNLFDDIVGEQQNEGLVIRNDRRVYKMKQNIDLDLVVVGYTLQQKDAVRSIALAIALPGGQFLHVGSVGTLGSQEIRKKLFSQLSRLACPSPYRMSASDGSLYQFALPQLVVSVSAKDVQNERHDGSPITRMAFAINADQLEPLHLTPSVSILHASLNEIRGDKKATEEDCGVQQLERAGFFIKDMKTDPKKKISSMQPSVISEKQVYVKTSKDGKAVKKFIILKTHKEDHGYPKYVFYFFDMSEKRKTPIQRDVRPFNDLKLAQKILNDYLDKNIKKGWEKI
ncbi:MAG TPA: RNA ligase family protein [Nitrospinaceae bacterium]|nr:RNA ligase family protein [Nitrospinaceae bacterium]